MNSAQHPELLSPASDTVQYEPPTEHIELKEEWQPGMYFPRIVRVPTVVEEKREEEDVVSQPSEQTLVEADWHSDGSLSDVDSETSYWKLDRGEGKTEMEFEEHDYNDVQKQDAHEEESYDYEHEQSHEAHFGTKDSEQSSNHQPATYNISNCPSTTPSAPSPSPTPSTTDFSSQPPSQHSHKSSQISPETANHQHLIAEQLASLQAHFNNPSNKVFYQFAARQSEVAPHVAPMGIVPPRYSEGGIWGHGEWNGRGEWGMGLRWFGYPPGMR